MERRRLLGGLAAGAAGLMVGGPRAAASLLRAQSGTVRLAVAGDVGTGQSPARQVAAAVANQHSARAFDGLVLLGDNVYPDGNPSKLDRTIFDPYGPVLRSAQLSAVIGNHDQLEGNAPRQVRAMNLPGRWYRRTYGDVLLVCLDSNLVGDSAQTRFLEDTLAGSSARWRIVALHHPPYSGGPRRGIESVRRRWSPIFEREGVQLVLSGHEHNYQRFAPKGGVTYVISGAGARLSAGAGRGTARHVNELHFLSLDIGSDNLDLVARDRGGRVVDDIVIRRG